ncbi:ketol-acid reductoisomerase [Pleionea sp. CnH1-48]|uniref:ketol-acid reductoisomerase n=1 Tax=Pleionea sp. CnH1-48 TaxID=2954494 RepID=UPI002096BCA4|nr:ketol-acid reductoisomerase [Pleionea sp. CnH1-48]MCO7227169.1 ketol-acid reductoisomerase [Pleionea sp. CnH1-48]
MTRLYGNEDAKPELLKGKKIAILGYGSQGRAHALNLRDSGFDVSLGLREGGSSWQLAEKDGWQPQSFSDAANAADLIMFLVPDMAQKALYEEYVAPGLTAGKALFFAHGFNIHYELIQPPKDVDVALVAPKSPGRLVRRQYEEGAGVPCLFATYQDATGQADELALAYAYGLGGTRAGVIKTTFSEETETDLFGEQAVLCGGATELVAAGFETLTKAGYQPEVAYFECLHELKLIVDLLYEGGFKRMHEFVSDTAKYGDLTRGPRVVDDHVRASMETILDEIRNGKFAKEWIDEHQEGEKNYRQLLSDDLDHPIESVGRQLRSHMTWLPAQ